MMSEDTFPEGVDGSKCARCQTPNPVGIFKIVGDGIVCENCLTEDEGLAAALDRPFWMNAGTGTFLLTNGKAILAVLYWAPAEVGFLDGTGGDCVEAPGQWTLVHADNAQQHHGLGEEDRADQQTALDAAQAAFVSHRIQKDI